MNHSVLQRITSFVLCAVIVFSAFLVFPVKAEGEEVGELYKMLISPAAGKADTRDKTIIDSYANAENDFETDSEAFEITKADHKGIRSVFIDKTDVENDDEEVLWPVTLSKTYETPLDLSEYSELFFRFSADETAEEGFITLEVTLYSGENTHTLKEKLDTNTEYDVFCPISQFEYLDTVTGISFTVDCPEEINGIVLSTLYADSSFHYSHIPLFTSDLITSKTGMELFEDRIVPTLVESAGEVTAKFTAIPEDCLTVCAMVTLSGAETGTVTLSAWDGVSEEYADIATLTLNKGKDRYSFVFPTSKGTVNYRLTFAGITEAENEKLTLHSAVMKYFSEAAFDSPDYPGNISSCSVLEGGSKIRINGTIRSNTVVNNLGAKLNVYAKDEFRPDGENITLMASVDITTVFEITFDTSKLKLNPYLYKYFVTISDGETEIYACSGVYPALTPANFTSGSSVLGIQSSDSAAAFKTNASHAVVDIYLDRLLSTDGKGGRVHSYGGSFAYLSGNYINELDSRITFLNGSGVNVYLRILWENKDENVPAIYMMPDCSEYEYCLSYMTMIDFLTSRYSEISGIIPGSRIDCLLYNYTHGKSIISIAEDYAKLLRLTAIAARPNAPEAVVMAPFGDGYIYGGDGDGANYLYDPLSGIGENAADPIMLSEILSRMIANYGGFKWYLLYECESAPTDAMNTAYKLAAQLTQGGGTSPSGHMVFWQPEKAITAKEIEELSEGISQKAISLGTGAVVISLTRHSVDPSVILGIIEKTSFGENTARTVTEHEGLVFLRPAPSGKYDLWDFTKSFSTEGFIYGGSVTSLSTEVSVPMAAFEGLDSCRCLSGTLDKESRSSGTVLCYFDTPKLLGNATAFDVSINLTSNKKTEVPVKIILGKGNVRYEYSVEVSPSTPSVIRCDTSIMDEKFAAEYMAVSIEAGAAETFEITKVSAVNKNYGEDTLREVLEVSPKNDSEITEESKFIIAAVAFIGITVVVFVLLNARSTEIKTADRKRQTSEKTNKD